MKQELTDMELLAAIERHRPNPGHRALLLQVLAARQSEHHARECDDAFCPICFAEVD
jgi:hypothetical protein